MRQAIGIVNGCVMGSVSTSTGVHNTQSARWPTWRNVDQRHGLMTYRTSQRRVSASDAYRIFKYLSHNHIYFPDTPQRLTDPKPTWGRLSFVHVYRIRFGVKCDGMWRNIIKMNISFPLTPQFVSCFLNSQPSTKPVLYRHSPAYRRIIAIWKSHYTIGGLDCFVL